MHSGSLLQLTGLEGVLTRRDSRAMLSLTCSSAGDRLLRVEQLTL